MKPGDDGVFPFVVYRPDLNIFEYGTARKTALSITPSMTRIGSAASLDKAAEALEALGWELQGNPVVTGTGKYQTLPIKGPT
jgi:hypothetical protein